MDLTDLASVFRESFGQPVLYVKVPSLSWENAAV